MIAPANARPNDRPNEPPAELTPAASLTRSSSIGRERVVVQLRDEQAEPGAGEDQRDDEIPARVGARHERQQHEDARRRAARTREDDPARAAVARLAAGDERDGEHRQRQRREREAGLHRVVLEHHLQVDRERDHHPAEGDLLQRLRLDPEPEVLSTRRARCRAAPSCPPACGGAATRRAAPSRRCPSTSSAPTASPPSSQTRIESTRPPMPTAESTAPTTSMPRAPVYGTSCTQPAAHQDDGDDRRPRRGTRCARTGRS